jgi:hypothetical protein
VHRDRVPHYDCSEFRAGVKVAIIVQLPVEITKYDSNLGWCTIFYARLTETATLVVSAERLHVKRADVNANSVGDRHGEVAASEEGRKEASRFPSLGGYPVLHGCHDACADVANKYSNLKEGVCGQDPDAKKNDTGWDPDRWIEQPFDN